MKRLVITGATSDIGLEAAQLLAKARVPGVWYW